MKEKTFNRSGFATTLTALVLFGFTVLFLLLSNSCSFLNTNSRTYGDLDKYERLNGDYSSFNTYKSFNDFKTNVLDSGEHIVYLGKPSCPWCKDYIYYYDLVSKETGKKIDYYNLENIKGELVETETDIKSYGTEYQMMYDLVFEYDKNCDLELTTTKKGVYAVFVPIIFKIKDGVILDVVGEVENHTYDENGLRELTDAEQKKFVNDLRLLFN